MNNGNHGMNSKLPGNMWKHAHKKVTWQHHFSTNQSQGLHGSFMTIHCKFTINGYFYFFM